LSAKKTKVSFIYSLLFFFNYKILGGQQKRKTMASASIDAGAIVLYSSSTAV